MKNVRKVGNRKVNSSIGGKERMPYSTKVLDHYNNPRNVGSFDKADVTVGTGVVGAPECGK